MSWAQWPNTAIPQPGVVQTPIINPAPNVVNPANPVIAGTNQYTPEQWAQMQQQNWQQWAQWQQQFQQWQQQYGAEFQKSLTAMAQPTTPTPVQPPLPFFNASAPPPLPTETKPPPPPDEPQTSTQTSNQASFSSSFLSGPPPAVPSQPPPPNEPFPNQYNQPQSNQSGFQNRNPNEAYKNENQQRFGGNNQNFPNRAPARNQNWQNANNRNQPTFGNQPPAVSNEIRNRVDYGAKRPFNQPLEAGDVKRNKMEMNVEINRWQPNQQKPKWGETPPSQAENPQWGSKTPENIPKRNPEELTEQEKKFDKQFAEWESQFQKWKEQNANHPDKEQYREYEKKWEAWRTQLLERREQMKRKRLGLVSGSPQPASAKPDNVQQKPLDNQQSSVSETALNRPYNNSAGTSVQPQISPRQPQIGPQSFPPITAASRSGFGNASQNITVISQITLNPNRPPPNMNDQPLEFTKTQSGSGEESQSQQENDLSTSQGDAGEGFLKSTSTGGIPGLDLVKDGKDEDKGEAEDDITDSKGSKESEKGPDLEAISRGINSILGDQKLLNMLSLVSQNQSRPLASNTVDTMCSMRVHSPKFSPPDSLQNEQSNQENTEFYENTNQKEMLSNIDEQTRSSFNIPNDADAVEPDKFAKGSDEFSNDNDNFNTNTDNFSRNSGNWNREPEFNRNFCNLKKGQEDNFIDSADDFGRSSDNFREFDNLNKSQDNFNRDPNSFNRGPSSFQRNFDNVRGPDSFNRNTDNFNRSSDNIARGTEAFNKDLGNINRGVDIFNKGVANLNRDPNDFNRGFDENPNRDSDNFNRDNFNRGPANFNRGPDNFNKSSDNFNRGSDNFYRGPGNFNKGPNNFNRGPDNFNRGPDNFNRGPDGFNRGLDNFNRGLDNFNREPDSFRKDPDNFNKSGNFNRESDNFSRGTDNFSRGPNNFNRGFDNFNRGPDSFNRGIDNSNRGLDNLNRGPDNFNRGPDSFSRGPDNFNRGPDNFNRGPNNFNRGPHNFNRGPDNFNRGPDNFNRGGPDNFQREQDNFGRGFDKFERSSNNNLGNFNRGPENSGRGFNDLSQGNRDDRGFNSFGKEPNIINRNVTDTANRFEMRTDQPGSDFERFGRKPDNLSREPGSFNEESNSYDRDQDHFNQAPQNLNRGDITNKGIDSLDGDRFQPPPLADWNRNDSVPPDSLPSSLKEKPQDKTQPLLDDGIWKPKTVIDYDHKSLKSTEPDVIVEAVYMFDYRHKPLNRIPYPQRPKWLLDMVKNYPEFDLLMPRSFEQQLRRYPVNERYDSRASGDYLKYDRTRKYYDDRERKPLDDRDRKPYDDYNRKPYDDRDRRPYEDQDRMSHDDRDKKSYDNSSKRSENRSDDRRPRDFGEKRLPDSGVDNKRSFNRDLNISDTDDYLENTRNDLFSKEKAHSSKEQKNEESFNIKASPVAPSKSNITLIEDLLSPPGRYNRAPRLVIILRGPPGSGKSFLAKLIKDKEVENGGSAPRILCLDDYFMIEQEKEVEEDGRIVKVKEMVYEYEECMEASYRQSLMKSFKKTITDGYFNFIIVDNINDKVKYFGEMWSFAKQNGFQVYICQLELDVQTCTKRNIHGRSEIEIERCVSAWEPTPSHHPTLDATSLIQSGSIPEVEMEEINSPPSENMNEEEHLISSKWDNIDYSNDTLAKLDGTNKPLRPSRTMEDYLQLDDEWVQPVSTKPGQKRVRWADLEERKQQEKMRAIGFVVGQTNWDRMMDPTMGSGALTQTKYIERYS